MIDSLKSLLALLLPESDLWKVILAACFIPIALLLPERHQIRRATLKGMAYAWGRFFRCPFGRHAGGIGAATFGESGDVHGFSVCRYCGKIEEF